MSMGATNMDVLVSLSKRRGFVFQSSEIYGGTGSCWDYGPLGVELKNNIKRVWWRDFVQQRADMVGIDASILMHATVWKASGHLDHFTDPMVDCRECKHRFRADHVDALPWVHYCPATKGNEITPGNFIFRTREFEQMEIEFFVNPNDRVDGRPADEYWHDRWIEDCMAWFLRYGLAANNLRLREHERDELAHYAKRTVDIEYRFPIGWSELMGIAKRTDFDLKQHTKWSGKSLTYFDDERKEHVVPYVVEPAAGVDRALLAFMADAYREEEVRGEKRVVLKLHPELAPIKVAVLPLLKKRDDIVRTAHAIRDELAKHWTVVYDDTAAIGRLYRRQDEVGTPYCVTVDVQTVGDTDKGESADGKVTIRDRDSMEQVRVPIDALPAVFLDLLSGGQWSALASRHPAAK